MAHALGEGLHRELQPALNECSSFCAAPSTCVNNVCCPVGFDCTSGSPMPCVTAWITREHAWIASSNDYLLPSDMAGGSCSSDMVLSFDPQSGRSYCIVSGSFVSREASLAVCSAHPECGGVGCCPGECSFGGYGCAYLLNHGPPSGNWYVRGVGPGTWSATSLELKDLTQQCSAPPACAPSDSMPPGYVCSGVLVPCAVGFFCNSTTPTPCPPGTYNSMLGAMSASACLPCPSGFTCPSLNTSVPNECPCPADCAATGLATVVSCTPSPPPVFNHVLVHVAGQFCFHHHSCNPITCCNPFSRLYCHSMCCTSRFILYCERCCSAVPSWLLWYRSRTHKCFVFRAVPVGLLRRQSRPNCPHVHKRVRSGAFLPRGVHDMEDVQLRPR